MNERLLKLCLTGLHSKNLRDDAHKSRLKYELKQISIKEDDEYFLDLHDKKLKYPLNQYNLLVVYLLGLADDFDIDARAAYEQGEMPDIDIDYIPQVQDYIRSVWAPKQFGERNVCSIGTVGSLGIKSAILDMTKLHDLDKTQIQMTTVSMDDKDDEGKPLEWDKAIELYPDFASFCAENPVVAEDAQAMLDRNKSAGVHAGGLIISSVPIDNFVPLEVRKVDPKTGEGVVVSAWSEGLKSQDLQAVGLVKFDVLAIINLLQIAYIIKLIKERHPEVETICALPDDYNWSDTAYLNDPVAIEMANKADLRGVFQFDSEGIRKLVQRGGVTSFDDLVAYNSLFRPSCLTLGMDARYYKRKRGEEEYFLHPLIEPILGRTYGVMVYQEQILRILHVVGDIPLIHCEKVRKAISKKKVEAFQKYKEMFLINGQKNLNANLDFVEKLWDQVVAFSGYGFNKTMDQDTYISVPNGCPKKIKDFRKGDQVYTINEKGDRVTTDVLNLHNHGTIEGYEVALDDGSKVVCSLDHKFLTHKGQVPLWMIIKENLSVLCSPLKEKCAEKEDWKLGSKVRTNIYKSYFKRKTSAKLRKVSRVMFQNWRLDSSLRKSVAYQKFVKKASAKLRRMSSIGVEIEQRISCDTQISMWNRISSVSHPCGSSEELSTLPTGKKGEYQSQKSFYKSIRRTSKSILRSREKNFSETRNSKAESGKIEKLEAEQPREICKNYRNGSKKSEEIIKDGKLDGVESSSWFYEIGSNQMRKTKEASGFCEKKDLDRNRWLLSFFSTQKEKNNKSQKFRKSASKRFDIKRRVFKKKKYNACEVKHGMFPFFNRCDEIGMDNFVPSYAPITDTRSLVHRKVIRVCPVGERQMFDLEVASSTHNFILVNGIVTSNSHATAYSMLSARLLWLKAYYPIEFYTAILMCEKDTEKYKDFCVDAEMHGVEVRPVDINKSKDNFSIVNNKIYFGFSNIKNIGAEVGTEIIAQQPYSSFKDFLMRFGTSASVLKGLISIGVFDELEPKYDHLTLYKFSLYYAKLIQSKKASHKRYLESLQRQQEDLRELLKTEVSEDDPNFELYCSFSDESVQAWEKFKEVYREEAFNYRGEQRVRATNLYNLLIKVLKGNQSTIRNKQSKEEEAELETVQLSNFNSSKIKVDEDFAKILENHATHKGKRYYPLAESFYYGFQWSSNIERSPLYKGYTIDDYLDKLQKEKFVEAYIEVEIMKVEKRKSKSGTEFYSVTVEDANGKSVVVNVWLDDYLRFAEELKKGNLARMMVRPPSGGYRTFSFSAPPKRFRDRSIPKNKEDDLRLIILPESNEDPRVNLEDLVMKD